MKRKLLFLSAVVSLLVAGTIGASSLRNEFKDAEAEINYLYNTNFENLDISGNVEGKYVNQVTGYVHANDYLHTKTVTHSGTTWLDCSIPESSTGYHTVGWIGGGGGLSKLRNGESYTVEIVADMTGFEFMYVEYKSNSYGAFTITPSGQIGDNGGNDMVDVSYNTSTKLLSFSFTAFNFDLENCPGYIQLVVRNASSSSKLFLKSIKIYHSEHVMNGTFEEYALMDNFNVNDSSVFSKNYINTPDITKASIVGDSNNHKLKFSSLNNAQTGAFFFNRLGMLVAGREYTFTIKYEQTNVLFMYIDYGGSWETNRTWSKIDFVWGGVVPGADGANCGWNVQLDSDNQLITIKFTHTSLIAEPNQFMFAIEDNHGNTGVSGYDFSISYAQIDVKSYPVDIDVDTSSFNNTTNVGEPFEWNNLVVRLVNADEKTTVLEYGNDYTVSGVDINVVGPQGAVISYLSFNKVIEVVVVGDIIGISVDVSNVETEIEFGEKLDLSGLIVKANLEGGGEAIINPVASLGGYSISYNVFDSYKPGEYVITVWYKDFSTSFTVEVLDSLIDLNGISYKDTGNK